MPERTVVLHYHLFKNAGTSIDRLLQRNFGDRWVTREFDGNNNSAAVARWIEETPEACAFSSHTMSGPPPRVDGVRIIKVMTLRDPIARIRSAYAFERKQQADSFGAVLAKHTDFEGYVRVRLALPWDRQCRDFQTARLASFRPGPQPEIDRALRAMHDIEVLGSVEQFGEMLSRLQETVGAAFEGFEVGEVHANRSGSDKEPMDAEVEALLRRENAGDLRLVDALGWWTGAAIGA